MPSQIVRSICAVVGVFGTLWACSDVTGIDAPGTREFRGLYVSGFEASSFFPCERLDGPVAWWTEFELTRPAVSLDSAIRSNQDLQNPFRATRLYLEVRARLSKPGAYGHLNSWAWQLTVLEVRRVAAWSDTECR